MPNWKDKIRNPDCELCPLHEHAEYVCLMGSGPKNADVMVIGEAPGAREDEEHRAFVGPAGKLLDELLSQAGLTRDDCYITNVAKCRPPENRTPELRELKICASEYLSKEIAAVEPRFILLLGNSALRGMVGRSGITKYRGTTFPLGATTAMAAFHPAYALRNPKHLVALQADFKRFGRLVRGEPDPEAAATKVKIVKTKKHLLWLKRQLAKAEVISYDIETTGLEEWHDDSRIVSISFSWAQGQAVVVPLWHHASPWERSWKSVLLGLKPELEREDAKYIAHNGKFDCRWLARFGVFVPQTFDTMLAAHLLDENRPKGLKPLSQVLLGVSAYDIGDDVRDAYNVPLRRLAIYNGKDTDYTLRLYYLFRQQLIEEPRLARIFKFLMMPASNALTRIERGGMYLDVERTEKILKKVTAEVNKAESELRSYVPEYNRDNINFNSHPQVGHWLFTELGLPIIERTGKGAPSSKESVLLRLAKEHPAPKALLEYRAWIKKQQFLASWLERVDEKGRVHTNYKLAGTTTGRLSSEKPNLQQVPREGIMRTCFGAPKNYYFIQADYSQVELRIAAMVSGDPTMLRAYLTGEDLHMKTACETTGWTPDQVDKETRKKAKAVNFGFLYGMGAPKFVEYARDNYDVEVSLEEAQAIRERFFQTYSRLRPWHDRQRRLVRRYQRVQSPIGRVRHLSDVQSSDKNVQAEAERQAINSPVQSLASDLMLLSLVRLSDTLPQRDARIVGTVHDSILLEARASVAFDVANTVKEVMEDMSPVKKMFGYEITVPIVADVEVTQHWGGKVIEL